MSAANTNRRSRRRPATRPSLFAIGLIIGAAITPAPGTAQSLTGEERAIAEHVDSHVDDGIALLERIVNINSGTLNPEGQRRVAEVLMPEFEALGFEVRYSPLPASLNRGGHLIAERRGTQGRSIVLIGHLDTVFEEDSPFQAFERIDENTARGPGVADMKGGDVVILQALRALDSVGALENTTITVIFTGDEESPGRPLEIARRDLVEAAQRSDVALGFEGGSRGGGTEYAVVARRSSSTWKLTVGGRTAHSSGVFSAGVGAGAIFEAARILNDFYEEVRGDQYLTFNPGTIVGGTDVEYDEATNRGTTFGKTNVVAQTAIAHGGIRTISDEQLERARNAMRAVVERNLPRTSAEIEFADGYPAMTPTDGNYELLAVYDEVSRALGYGAVEPFDPGGRGAADISFAAPHVEAALGGLGPYGSGSHSEDETLDLSSLPKATKRAALLIYRLTRPEAME